MQKYDIFNKKKPSPTDKFVYPIFKDYQRLQKEIVRNWVEDVAKLRLFERGFADLKTTRFSMKETLPGNFVPVLSLRPVIGQQVHERLAFYINFFELYKSYRNTLIQMITEYDCVPWDQFPRKLHSETRILLLKNIHIAFSVIRILIVGYNSGGLKHKHLDTLTEAKDISTIHNLIRDLGIESAFSKEFNQGGNFYDRPDSDLMKGFWTYTRKLYMSEGKSDDDSNRETSGVDNTSDTTTLSPSEEAS